MKKLTKKSMVEDIIQMKNELISLGKGKLAYRILSKYNKCDYESNTLLERCLMYKSRDMLVDIRGEFMMATTM